MAKKTQSNLFDDAKRSVSDNSKKERQEKKTEPALVFSVGEFLDYVNEIFKLKEYAVVGEISDFSLHPSGAYFAVKDTEGNGIMYCYMGPYRYRICGVTLEDGLLVKIHGSPNIYKPKGKFSFVVEKLELSGEGSIRKAYEALKKRLEEEGLFTRKRPIPEFVLNVGIVTSKTGAVIGDFKKNLKSLGLKLFLYDVRVEGTDSVRQISEAIRAFNTIKNKPDVIVLIRGGGSLEDLQAFNSEMVAREVFASSIPVIAGVGHDRDVPIVSLVSDCMTSTPSFAATTVNDSWNRLFHGVPAQEERLTGYFQSMIFSFHERVVRAGARLSERVFFIQEKYQNLFQVIFYVFSKNIESTKRGVEIAEKIINAMDPMKNLRLGYSIVFNENGKVLKSVEETAKGKKISARISDGSIKASVEGIINWNKE